MYCEAQSISTITHNLCYHHPSSINVFVGLILICKPWEQLSNYCKQRSCELTTTAVVSVPLMRAPVTETLSAATQLSST
jgi:hypothetical protein